MSCLSNSQKIKLSEILEDVFSGFDGADAFSDVDEIECYDESIVNGLSNDAVYDGAPLFESFSNGASKVVFFLNSAHPNKFISELAKKICVKVPVRGYEEGDEYIHADYSIDDMNHLRQKDEEEYFVNDWDYCDAESAIYRFMKVRGCHDVLAETFLLTYACDDCYPIYVSELMDTNFDNDYWSCSSSKEIVKDSKTYEEVESGSSKIRYWFDDDNIKYYIAQDYGVKKLFKVMDLFKKIRVFDICSRNCGWDSKHRIKILDYSSFND